MKLQNKVVIITGSTRGIGRSIALACAHEGASVIISSRSPEAVLETVNEMKAQNYAAAGITCDTTVSATSPLRLRIILKVADVDQDAMYRLLNHEETVLDLREIQGTY